MLQNDMGNSRIQDRITGSIMGLKEGFIPLAMKEHGGVLYIASYNPQTRTSELGSIPSPLFDYTSYIPSDDTDCGVALLDDNYTTPESPIILNLDNDTLFYPGDAIKCGLTFDGEMPNLKRSAYIKSDPSGKFEISEVVYPYISTREKPGLLTLHALAIPSNSSEIIDLDLHKFDENKVSKQWFFDSSNQSSSQDVDLVIYPNIQSGQLAVMPVLQTISEIQVLTNASTGKFEPYYIYQDSIIITVYFSKIKKVQRTQGNNRFPVIDKCKIKINEETHQVSTLDELQLSYITDDKINITIDNIDKGSSGEPDTRTVIINGVKTPFPEGEKSLTVTTIKSINIEINDEGWFKNQSLPFVKDAL